MEHHPKNHRRLATSADIMANRDRERFQEYQRAHLEAGEAFRFPSRDRRDVRQEQGFMSLSNGFRRAFEGREDRPGFRIPIVGYTGHRSGCKAQNFYGKNYRESMLYSLNNNNA